MLLVCIVLVISLVGCSKSLTKKEYIKEVNKISCGISKKYENQNTDNVSDALTAIIKPAKEMVSKLKVLKPESSIKKEHEKMISLWEDFIASLKKKDLKAITKELDQLKTVAKKLDVDFDCKNK